MKVLVLWRQFLHKETEDFYKFSVPNKKTITFIPQGGYNYGHKKSEIILLAVKPQNAPEALSQCKKALDGKALMSIVAGVTVERLQNMIDGTPRILRLLPNTPAMVCVVL